MKINLVRLQNFRNVDFAEVDMRADSIWIYGQNAQGKTNLLEAAGLLSALRSFRTTRTNAMIKQGHKEADVLAEIEHEKFGSCQIRINLTQKRSVFLDGAELKLGEFIGKFPALAMSSEDIRLIRGAPEIRRRDIDMFISSIDSQYFESLCAYHKTMSQRNALLKTEISASDPQFDAFEIQMAHAANDVCRLRKTHLAELGDIAAKLYAKLAGQNAEAADLRFRSDSDISSAEDFLKILQESRDTDKERGHTRHGPHRDELNIHIDSKDAKNYASEGQQRSAVLAIKLAQFSILKKFTRVEPIILCDDILGELDASRREAFWECVPDETQIIASSTSPAPVSVKRNSWKMIEVSKGNFSCKE